MPAEIIRHALIRAPDDSASLNFPGRSDPVYSVSAKKLPLPSKEEL